MFKRMNKYSGYGYTTSNESGDYEVFFAYKNGFIRSILKLDQIEECWVIKDDCAINKKTKKRAGLFKLIEILNINNVCVINDLAHSERLK